MRDLYLLKLLGEGLDDKKALKRLQTVGVESLWQVPLYLPSRYLDARDPIIDFEKLCFSGVDVVVVGHYAGDFKAKWGGGKSNRGGPLSQGSLSDVRGRRLTFSMFGDGRPFQKALEEVGDGEVALAGSLQCFGGYYYLNRPAIIDPALLGKVVPIYPGRARLLSASMARRAMCVLLEMGLAECATKMRSYLPDAVDGRFLRRLLGRPQGTLDDLLWDAHFPTSPEDGEFAQQSLERLSALATINELNSLKYEPAPVRRRLSVMQWEDLLARIPFELTEEQHNAVELLIDRFCGENSSFTLINADVGMGKSIVYQLACAAAVRTGGRAAVLLPNERLAIQAFEEIQALFPELRPELVTGRSSGGNGGLSPWLIGTTAMLFREVGKFDVCVIDEQHRFSVEQRKVLADGGAHIVEVSATPIPRTQALLLYGNMDVIRLTKRHSPQDIRTKIVDRAHTQDMVRRLHEIIEMQGRVLIVCPRREEAEDDSGGDALPSVARVAEKWSRLFPGLVRALHGESAPEEVSGAFSDLASGRARILVATTVVEVGLNIKNLRGVVIVHAERFGISQLHQLRGRLAREGGAGECFFYLPRVVGPDSSQRLEALVSSTDGFELAEFDMRARGVGDVSSFGARQHGSAGSLLLNRVVPMSTFLEVLEAVNS